MRRMKFGASSEKLDHAIAQLELALEELEAEASTVAEGKPVSARAERPAPVRSFPPHLPREEIIHEPLQGSCTCPDCGGTLRKLSADSDEMLDVVPVHWRVIRHVRPKYSCRSCEKIIQAPAPVKAIARGKATFATLAHVVVSKFDRRRTRRRHLFRHRNLQNERHQPTSLYRRHHRQNRRQLARLAMG